MASPQKENGFTPIAHEIIEHLARVKMSGTEWQYAMCVFRKTYGWGKKEDWITNSQIVVMTGLKKERVSEAKSRLIERNIVTENRNKISFQKDWEKWVELRKSVTIVTEKRNSELRKSVHTIDTITIDKNKGDSNESHIKSNEELMAWNKQPDDEAEVIIDADSGEEIKPAEKAKRHYKEVYALFEEILEKDNPANWLVNTTQQKCAENLYTERKLPAIKNALQWYVLHKDKEFCPQISSPSDLDGKWTKLATFKKNYGN